MDGLWFWARWFFGIETNMKKERVRGQEGLSFQGGCYFGSGLLKSPGKVSFLEWGEARFSCLLGC